MPIGQYILGGLIGLIFGTAVAAVGAMLTRRSLEKSKTSAVLGVSFLRQLMDILALLVVFLLRKVMPFHLYAVLIGTAMGLSVGGIVLVTRISKKMEQKNNDN